VANCVTDVHFSTYFTQHTYEACPESKDTSHVGR